MNKIILSLITITILVVSSFFVSYDKTENKKELTYSQYQDLINCDDCDSDWVNYKKTGVI